MSRFGVIFIVFFCGSFSVSGQKLIVDVIFIDEAEPCSGCRVSIKSYKEKILDTVTSQRGVLLIDSSVLKKEIVYEIELRLPIKLVSGKNEISWRYFTEPVECTFSFDENNTTCYRKYRLSKYAQCFYTWQPGYKYETDK